TLTGTAFLTTRVGPGATIADEVARYNYTVTSPLFPHELKTLFSGLTLGAGTYYLIISGSGSGGWIGTDKIFPVMAQGLKSFTEIGPAFRHSHRIRRQPTFRRNRPVIFRTFTSNTSSRRYPNRVR